VKGESAGLKLPHHRQLKGFAGPHLFPYPSVFGRHADGGLIVWSHFLRQKRFRQQLRELLPHDPTDVTLSFMGGILCGADKLSRVAWLQSDLAVAEVMGIEAVASQSTLSRFFGVFNQRTCQALGGLHSRAHYSLPSEREGYTRDLVA
jgi:hypothetical protein